MTPAAGEAGVSIHPVLGWSEEGRGGLYQIEMGRAPDELVRVAESAVPLHAVRLGPGETWYWRVIPASGPATPVASFTTREALLVNTAADPEESADGVLSLRQALQAAAASPGCDLIRVAPELAGETLSPAAPLELHAAELRIEGSGMGVSAPAQEPVFIVSGGSLVELSGLMVAGREGGLSRALTVDGGSELTLEGCGFSGHAAGAALVAGSSRLIARGCFFHDNSANSGSALLVEGHALEILLESCDFSGNRAGAVTLRPDDSFNPLPLVTPLTVRACRFAENVSSDLGRGAAIHATGRVSLSAEASSFQRNQSYVFGAALYIHANSASGGGPVTLAECSFIGNTSAVGGSPAVSANSVELHAVNCLVAGNDGGSNDSAVSLNYAEALLEFCTIAGNRCVGLKLDAATTAGLRACLIARNQPYDVSLKYGLVSSLGGNILGNNNNAGPAFPAAEGINVNGDRVGDVLSPLDPLIDWTGDAADPDSSLILLSGSPAWDSVADGFPARDLRGVPRPQNAAADAGAIECEEDLVWFAPDNEGDQTPVGLNLRWRFAPQADRYRIWLGESPHSLTLAGESSTGRFTTAPLDWSGRWYWRVEAVDGGGNGTFGPLLTFTTRGSVMVDLAADVVDPEDGLTSLREAVDAASAPGLHRILIAPDLAGATLSLDSPLPISGKWLLIETGDPAGRLTCMGPANAEAIQLRESELTLRGMDFVPHPDSRRGCIIGTGSRLILENCTFSSFRGCVVDCRSAPLLDFRGCSFTTNNSPDPLLSVTGDAVILNGCGFNGNTGGAWPGDTQFPVPGLLPLQTASVEVEGCSFNGNRSWSGGLLELGRPPGQVFGFVAEISVRNSTFTNNEAIGGGALALWSGSATVEGCSFTANRATSGGGAILLQPRVSLLVNRCSFAGNRSDAEGGAILQKFLSPAGDPIGGVTIANSTFHGNLSADDGGACVLIESVLFHVTVVGNTAKRGYGGLCSRRLTTTPNRLVNSIVAGNSALLTIYEPDLDSGFELSGVNLIGSYRFSRSGPYAPGLPNQLGQYVGDSTPTNGVPLDPRLAPFNDYAGAACMPPVPGSFAIGSADPAAAAELGLQALAAGDQTGMPRPFGVLPCIGAVEARPFSAFGLLDADGDGIDDRIEPLLGLVVGEDDSGSDRDGDGQPDAAELEAMTDPLSAETFLRILSVARAPAGGEAPDTVVLRVRWASVPGVGYQIQTAAAPVGFTPAEIPPVIAIGNETQWDVPMPPGHRFLRITTVPR